MLREQYIEKIMWYLERLPDDALKRVFWHIDRIYLQSRNRA